MSKHFKNYYEILEIEESSTPDQIYEGYMRAKNAFSGDSLALYSIMSGPECDKVLNLIEEAYSILSVPQKRLEYDRARGFNSQASEERYTANGGSVNVYSEPEAPAPQAVEPNEDAPAEGEEFNIKRVEAEVSKISAQKRFGLNYEKDNKQEQEIEKIETYTGETLRKIREYKNVDIPRMADMTRVSKTYIKAIEEDAFDKLPAMVYVRGFVYQYAKCLKLSPELVATSYMHHLKSLKDASN